MLYNELIDEVTRRVESVKSISDQYRLSFAEKLSIWLEDFEHDVLISKGSNTSLTEEQLANAAFEKQLDEEVVRKPYTPPIGIQKETPDVFDLLDL